MITLALDTCLNACSTALVRDGEALAVRSEPMVRGHQERLALMVQEIMSEAGAAFADIDRLAVTLGPGSFTGLRVGLAFAKGMAVALDIPCIGVSSLEALAASAPRKGLTLALVDARRDQAYWQAFKDGAAATPPAASTLPDIIAWAAEHGGPAALIGPGAPLLSERFPNAELIALAGPDPVAIAVLAADRAPGSLSPLYLRTPDAKLPGGVEPTW